MPRLGSDGRPSHVKIKKPKKKAGPPTPNPRSRPAPKKQPGPSSDAEQRKIVRHKKKPTYSKALQKARVKGPATRRGSKRPGGDDKSNADRARADTFWQRRAEQAVGYDRDFNLIEKRKLGGDERKILENMGLTRRKGFLVNRYDEHGPNFKLTPSGDRARKALLKVTHKAGGGGTIAGPASDYVAGKTLDNLSRPVHAVAGAARHDIKQYKKHGIKGVIGHGSLAEAKKGFTHETRYTGADVLKEAGVKNKTVRTVGGLVFDIAFDPTQGGKASRLAPKEALERGAREAEARAATALNPRKIKGRNVRPTRPKKATRLQKKADRLRNRAKAASESRGVQVGYSAKIPFGPRVEAMTTGRVTSKIGKKLAPAAERVQRSRPVQTGEALVAPTARHTDETLKESRAFTYEERKKRSAAHEAKRKARRRGTAHARATTHVDADELIAAVEGAAKKPLLNTKVVKRKTAAAKAVPKARKRLDAAVRREQRELGRVDVAAPAARRETLRIAVSRLKADKIKSPTIREAIEDYISASKAANRASRELTNANKAYRNTHGGINPKSKKPTGAPSMYDDAARATATKRLAAAKKDVAAARDTLRVARARAEEAAELEAGKAAGRKAADQIRNLDRGPAAKLNRLNTARANTAAARAELDAATEAAKGAPRYERYRIDAGTGQRYSDFRVNAAKYGVKDLPARAQKVAKATTRELEDLRKRQKAAGVLEGERAPYYPHRMIPDDKPRIIRRKSRAAKTPYGKRRADERPIAEQHAERAAKGKGPVFSTDHPSVIADYVEKSEKAIVDSKYLRGIKRAGKPLTASTWAKRRPTDALYRITNTGIQAVKHPNGKPLSDAEVNRLIADGEDVTILPQSRGDAEVAGRLGGHDEKTRAALRVINKPMQIFKTTATVLNVPYYQIRNLMDDTFRAWQGDTTASAFFDAARLVKDLALREKREMKRLDVAPIEGTVRVAGKDMPREQFLQEALEDGGLRTGFYAGEDLLEGSMKPAVGARRIRPVQKIREWNVNMEDVPRLAAYKAARDRGYTREEASRHIRLFMFDYDELTNIERAIRATFIPFYTYAKKNTALQARMLISRPGKLALIEKLRIASEKYGADTDEYRESVAKVEPWLKEAIKEGLYTKAQVAALRRGEFESLLSEVDQRGVPTLGPDGSLTFMPLGITDINRIPLATSWDALQKMPKQQFDLAMQMLGPWKVVPELALDYSFFFKDAIYRSADNPEAERWVSAPPWAKKTGIPTTRIVIDGKKVDAWPAWFDYGLRSLGPQTGMLATVGNPASNARGASAKDTLKKQLTGVRTSALDDRLLNGIVSQASKELGKVKVQIADVGDIPENRGKTADSYFYTPGYQALLDRQKALLDLIRRVRSARLGIKPQKTIKLTRRPLSYEQELEKKYDEKAKKLNDYEAELERKYEREDAKRRIQDKLATGGP